MTTEWLTLIIIFSRPHLILVLQSCEFSQENYKDLSSSPEFRVISNTELGIAWHHLVANISSDCLHSIELREGISRNTVQILTNKEHISQGKPFEIKGNICKDGRKIFQVVFVIFNKKGKKLYIGSERVTYKVPPFFLRNETPPYCLYGDQLRLALLEKMVKPSEYRTCVLKVETCMCKECSNCQLKLNSNKEDELMVVERKVETGRNHSVRIYYYWEHARQKYKEVSKQIDMTLEEDHCDDIFKIQNKTEEDLVGKEDDISKDTKSSEIEDIDQMNKATKRSGEEGVYSIDIKNEHEERNISINETEDKNLMSRISGKNNDDEKLTQLSLIGGGIVGCLVIILTVIVFSKKVRRKDQTEEHEKDVQEEIVEQNPDYGVDNYGVDYQESAFTDSNIYYYGEDSDDENVKTFVSDKNPYYDAVEYDLEEF